MLDPLCKVTMTRKKYDHKRRLLRMCDKYPNLVFWPNCISYTMGCPPVRGDNPRALAKARGLSPRTGGQPMV